MRYWIHVIVVVLLGCLLGSWIPWWSIAIIGFTSAFILNHKFGLSGVAGLFAGIILWAGMAFYLDAENGNMLSVKMGSLFGGLGSSSLIAITGLIGGMIVAFASMAGSASRSIIAKNDAR